MIQVSYR